GLVHDDGHARMTAHDFLRGVLQRVQVVLRQPVAGKRVRRADSQVITLDGQESARADPTVEDGGGQFSRYRLEELGPKAIQHRRRPHLRTELSTGVDSSGASTDPDICAEARAHRDKHLTRRDRKSTRLNSSHQIISYAVFCLKKKKKKKQEAKHNTMTTTREKL